MKKNKVVFPVRIVLSIIILLALCFAVFYIAGIVKNLNYFNVRNTISNESGLHELTYLKERNIFGIDLKKESARISELYPEYKKIRLVRILPNTVFVDFIKRKPQAFVKLYRLFCVDEDGVLFNLPGQLEEPDLPLIMGLETKIFGPKQGKKYNVRELTLAIDIIKEVKSDRVLKDYKIKRIDVSNINNASFFISGGLEVKIGPDDIKDKFDILRGLFVQERAGLAGIKYIDLRFKEPVIKLKDAK